MTQTMETGTVAATETGRTRGRSGPLCSAGEEGQARVGSSSRARRRWAASRRPFVLQVKKGKHVWAHHRGQEHVGQLQGEDIVLQVKKGTRVETFAIIIGGKKKPLRSSSGARRSRAASRRPLFCRWRGGKQGHHRQRQEDRGHQDQDRLFCRSKSPGFVVKIAPLPQPTFPRRSSPFVLQVKIASRI